MSSPVIPDVFVLVECRSAAIEPNARSSEEKTIVHLQLCTILCSYVQCALLLAYIESVCAFGNGHRITCFKDAR